MRPSDKVQSSATGKIKLRESYKQAKLTIEELATKANVSLTQLSAYSVQKNVLMA
jgi:hypothetical protein